MNYSALDLSTGGNAKQIISYDEQKSLYNKILKKTIDFTNLLLFKQP